MPTTEVIRDGHIVTIPLDPERVAVGQVVATYMKSVHYFAIFKAVCRRGDAKAIAAALDSPVILLAASLDGKVHAGHWTVVGNRAVDIERMPFPEYLEGVSPPGSFEVVDHTGRNRRRATEEEVRRLRPRKVVAPVRLEKAARALQQIEPWVEAYDELLAQ